MILLVFAAIIFMFLLLGSLVFIASALVPPSRRYALSAALWCAVWGPCSVGLLGLAGVGLVATAFITKSGDMETFHTPHLLAVFGWSYLTICILVTMVLATAVAWLHQFLIHRLTFALFRLYATAVSAGIGSVFGWCLGWWLVYKEFAWYHGWPLWVLGMLVLIVVFGAAAYRGARGLRGDAPKKLTWISAKEFEGL
jgi:hypothetical protein